MKLRKTGILLSAIIFLMLMNVAQLKAQGVPTACGGDPDIECPIDTPVILLVAAVLFLSVKKIADAKRTLKHTA